MLLQYAWLSLRSKGGVLTLHDRNNDTSLRPAVEGLKASVALQPRNAEGGLWYYNNVANLSAYRGLSYLDGMYSYPLFALLSEGKDLSDEEDGAPSSGICHDVYAQFHILYEHCIQTSGLLSHGYDAFGNHSWADPVTGASPIIWGRALSWYTLGLLNVLQSSLLDVCSSIVKASLQQLLEYVIEPQLTAAEQSRAASQLYGVWQVVDRPSKAGNFIESSASFLTAYSMLRAVRLDLIPQEKPGRVSVTELATGIFYYNVQNYLFEYDNGTVSLEGTSTVASLRDDVVDYQV